MKRSLTSFAILTVAAALVNSGVYASDTPPLSGPKRFNEATGQALFQGICQGCHMPEAQGAEGAGRYPALAHNPRLAAAAYPIYMVSQGGGGMPSFKEYLTDEQIAEVVNYVRTNFDNHYADTIKADDVKKISLR